MMQQTQHNPTCHASMPGRCQWLALPPQGTARCCRSMPEQRSTRSPVGDRTKWPADSWALSNVLLAQSWLQHLHIQLSPATRAHRVCALEQHALLAPAMPAGVVTTSGHLLPLLTMARKLPRRPAASQAACKGPVMRQQQAPETCSTPWLPKTCSTSWLALQHSSSGVARLHSLLAACNQMPPSMAAARAAASSLPSLCKAAAAKPAPVPWLATVCLPKYSKALLRCCKEALLMS